MNGVNIPYLPTSLWLLAGALTILLLFVVFGYYIYWREREKAILQDASDAATLAARKQTLQADIETLRQWINEQKAELDRLTAEREEQERLRAQLADLEQQCATKDQENQTLRNEVGELENQRHSLSNTLEKLEREIGNLEAKRGEAQAIEMHLAEMKTKLEEAQESMRGLAEAQAKLVALSAEKVSLEKNVGELRREAESDRLEAVKFRRLEKKYRNDAESAERELATVQTNKERIEKDIRELKDQESLLHRIVENLKKKKDDLDTAAKIAEQKTSKYLQIADKASADAQRAKSDLDAIVRDKQRLDIEVAELNARKAALKKEIEKLDAAGGSTLDGKAYDDLLKIKPACLSPDKFLSDAVSLHEEEILEQLKQALEKEGLKFSERVIYSFHTSLKCHSINPLTVLAGVSGTGKTLLPVKYAEIMGMHSLILSVQPRWDSPQDMFGFYNYLEKKYKATDLARALIRMDLIHEFPGVLDPEKSDRMLLILLDEMNLARTEYYFSEFLSKLELRRLVGRPNDPASREQAEIVLDTGPDTKEPFRIWVGDNILFVGTMNEDETTQTLSDKVLDRANVLRFGKPTGKVDGEPEGDQSENTLPRKYLQLDRWLGWIQPYSSNESWVADVEKWMDELNNTLYSVGRPFGYRVQKTIKKYVANYPGVDADSDKYKLAFADQVEQKIIPKLRGLDLTDHGGALQDIFQVIQRLNDDPLAEAFVNAKDDKTLGMFVWRGAPRPVEKI